jgi:hypothetical protein
MNFVGACDRFVTKRNDEGKIFDNSMTQMPIHGIEESTVDIREGYLHRCEAHGGVNSESCADKRNNQRASA